MTSIWNTGDCLWLAMPFFGVFIMGMLLGMRISDSTWNATIETMRASIGDTKMGGRPRA